MVRNVLLSQQDENSPVTVMTASEKREDTGEDSLGGRGKGMPCVDCEPRTGAGNGS